MNIEASSDGGNVTLHNYTPHAVTVYTGDTVVAVLPCEGVARAAEGSSPPTPVRIQGTSLQVEFRSTVYGAVEGLPDPVPGVMLVVSGLVLDHPSVAHRTDLCAPGTPIRNEAGVVIGCRGLRVRQ